MTNRAASMQRPRPSTSPEPPVTTLTAAEPMPARTLTETRRNAAAQLVRRGGLS